jgi:hypothetical protein
MKDTLLRSGAAVVLAHLVVTLPHGAAHAGEAVWLSPFANAYVALVIGLAPLLALGLLRTGRLGSGALLLFSSMLGALLFGIAYHYLIPGADNIAQVPAGPWQLPFQITSALLVVTEGIGTIVGAWMLYVLSRATVRSGQHT